MIKLCNISGVTLTACQIRQTNSEDEYNLMCDENGLFNTTQCSSQDCWCVNKHSGEALPGTTRPKIFFDLECAFLGGKITNAIL